MWIDMHMHEKTYSLDSFLSLEEIVEKAKGCAIFPCNSIARMWRDWLVRCPHRRPWCWIRRARVPVSA